MREMKPVAFVSVIFAWTALSITVLVLCARIEELKKQISMRDGVISQYAAIEAEEERGFDVGYKEGKLAASAHTEEKGEA